MANEIEHKYLVKGNEYKQMSTRSVQIVQGYISRDPDKTVRVRRTDNKCFVTFKGRNNGDSRLEFEYEIPIEDFESLLNLCFPNIISKRRWYVEYQGYTWEVDEFADKLQGLAIAEIELTHSHHNYPLPPFVSVEVTDNPHYYNSNLSQEQLLKTHS